MELVGFSFFAFLVSSFNQALSTASINHRTSEQYRLQMDALAKFLRRYSLPVVR